MLPEIRDRRFLVVSLGPGVQLDGCVVDTVDTCIKWEESCLNEITLLEFLMGMSA